MNSTIKAIMERSSIRKYKNEKISDEQISCIVKAALAAPSAVNSQPWHFIVSTNSSAIEELEKEMVEVCLRSGNEADIQRLFSRNKKTLYDVPLLIMVTSKLDGYFHFIDCGIAIQSIVIAAQSMGLSSVVIGSPSIIFEGDKKEYFKDLFKFPKGHKFVCAVGIGYADMQKEPHKLDMSKVTYIK